jgi:hypothetical protein
MISKRPERKPGKPDNFTYLAEYIAAAREPGEKLDQFWIENCNAGDDLEHLKFACYEVEAIRAQKPNIAEKTYHFVVSFRPEDRAKLTPEVLKEIEREFAKDLGFAEHQRVAGTHVNTDHYHMHVAINKVHPKTLRVRSPYNDYPTRERTCRRLEKQFGLVVDRGKDQVSEHDLSAAARDSEARTWQQSFESHLKENKADVLAAISESSSWREVHEALADFDAGIKRHGAGLVFYHLSGRKAEAMKASSLDRSCSLKALQDRLGPYEPSEHRQEQDGPRPEPPTPRRPYIARPLIHHPGQDRLWRTYRQEKRAPGFISRNFLNTRSWRDYLLADAHKDALAMAIIVSYRELLHSLEGSPAPRTHVPKSIVPALGRWFRELPWETPDTAALHPDYLSGVGMKIDGDNRVVLPLRDRDGRTWALRAVDQQGLTSDMGDVHAAPPGLRHVLDRKHVGDKVNAPWRGPVAIATNCTTAVQIHKATGMPVVIAAREKDLVPIASELRRHHPEAEFVVVSSRYPGAAAKAAKAASGKVTTAEAAIALATDRRTVNAPRVDQAATVDRRTAEAMGAFEEQALSLADVIKTAPATKSPEKHAQEAGEAATGEIVSVPVRVVNALGAIHEDALAPENANESAKHAMMGKPVPGGKSGASRNLDQVLETTDKRGSGIEM